MPSAGPTASASTATSDLRKYKKATDKEHVLMRPDTYVGATQPTEMELYVADDPVAFGEAASEETPVRIVKRSVTVSQALLKLFDEILVNARDHVTRCQAEKSVNQVTKIDVTIDPVNGVFTIRNNGEGIDVALHPDYKIWIPELIFANLRTSTTYEDEDGNKNGQPNTIGGKNGFGAKLAFLFSDDSTIETLDAKRQKLYKQHYGKNLSTIDKPSITKATKKPYTQITVKPDLARLGGGAGFSADTVAVMTRRVYDIAAVTDKTVQVTLNGKKLGVRSLEHYASLLLGASKTDHPRVYERCNERWEYVVALAPNHEFESISFVNGVYTRLGGSHVKHVMDQICKRVADKLSAKRKDVTVKPNQIRPHLLVLLNSVIEDPAFDSQSKETLTSPVAKFGSRAVVSDKAIDKISKLGLYERAMALHGIQDQAAASKSDGRKTRRITGVPKLTDAEKAGGPESHKCKLLLVEGDSAKTGVIGGMTAQDRDYLGVFPLRGKLLNVRGSSAKQINDNAEIAQFKKIMGLENGRVYGPEDIKRLRYGKVLIVTDQDKDGSHIKGLIANAIDVLWPSLLAIPGFLSYMNTPILKAVKGSGKKKQTLTFYSERDYHTWVQSPVAKGNWEIKYYKGLGTSTGPEFKEYLADPQVVDFVRSSQDPKQLDAALDLAFNSKRANERKGWIEAGSLAEVEAAPPIYHGKMEMSQFVNGELRGFSIYDCDRSIPSVIDGFKTSVRKIIFSCFKRNLTKELKVAQLAGYVAEHSLYHHGEGSLNGAIINLAQDYTGSNNLNLLVPAGQFGSRVLGGKDAASPRYIFTHLSPLARLVFPEHDDAVLEFLQEDGIGVEPRHYVPVIPMLLVNGSKGIGTGYSSDVPCYDLGEVIRAVRARVQGQPSDGGGWVPSWRGFKGTVTIVTNPKTQKRNAVTQGIVRKLQENVYEITELPITMCQQDLKNKLEALSEGKRGEEPVKDYKEYNTVDDIRVLVEFRPGVASDVAAVVRVLGLTDSIKLSNMHAFNSEGRITKYDGPEAILDEYIPVRRALYVKRKEHLIRTVTEKANALHEQAIFVRALCDGKLVVSRRPDEEVEKNMVGLGIRRERVGELLGMSIRSQTESKVAALESRVEEVERELAVIKKATIEELWLRDLAALEAALAK